VQADRPCSAAALLHVKPGLEWRRYLPGSQPVARLV